MKIFAIALALSCALLINVEAQKPPRKPSKKCHDVCELLRYCPSLEKLKERMQTVPNDCKECVSEECRNKINARCISRAMVECFECPTLNYRQQMEAKLCKTCLKRCTLLDDEEATPTGQSKPATVGGSPFGGGPPRGGRPPFFGQGVGPFRGGGRPNFAGGRPPFSGGNRPPFLANLTSIRGLIQAAQSGGLPISGADLSRIVGLISGGGAGPNTEALVKRLNTLISCAKDNGGCASCPTLAEAKAKIANVTAKCRECVVETCGDLDKLNSTLRATKCIAQARYDCLLCSPLTDSEQIQEKMCTKCLKTKCSPLQRGGGGRGGFPQGGSPVNGAGSSFPRGAGYSGYRGAYGPGYPQG